MFFYFKALLRAFILPPGICLLLTLLGTLLVWRKPRYGVLPLLLGVGSLWLCCTPMVADGLARLAERYPPFDPDRPSGAQAIVILGGGGERLFAPEYHGAVADPWMLERLALGAYLAQRLSLPVMTSGAPEESIAMPATLVRNFGITPRWVEGQSQDTYENARFCARILLPAGVQRIILVTTSVHEWRAAHEFMAAGFEVIPAPAGMRGTREHGVFRFVPSPFALLRSNTAIYELLGEPMRQLQTVLGVRERFEPT